MSCLYTLLIVSGGQMFMNLNGTLIKTGRYFTTGLLQWIYTAAMPKGLNKYIFNID